MVAQRNAASSLAESSQRRLLVIETHPSTHPLPCLSGLVTKKRRRRGGRCGGGRGDGGGGEGDVEGGGGDGGGGGWRGEGDVEGGGGEMATALKERTCA